MVAKATAWAVPALEATTRAVWVELMVVSMPVEMVATEVLLRRGLLDKEGPAAPPLLVPAVAVILVS